MKYYCDNCGSLIDEDDIGVWQEKLVGFGDDPDKCRHEYCPVCHEEYTLSEAGRCECCGEYISPLDDYCGSCQAKITELWNGLIDGIKELFEVNVYNDAEEKVIEWLEADGRL